MRLHGEVAHVPAEVNLIDIRTISFLCEAERVTDPSDVCFLGLAGFGLETKKLPTFLHKPGCLVDGDVMVPVAGA